MPRLDNQKTGFHCDELSVRNLLPDNGKPMSFSPSFSSCVGDKPHNQFVQGNELKCGYGVEFGILGCKWGSKGTDATLRGSAVHTLIFTKGRGTLAGALRGPPFTSRLERGVSKDLDPDGRTAFWTACRCTSSTGGSSSRAV
eukprot:1156834-Pelagomonas_calceolata.AAC.3